MDGPNLSKIELFSKLKPDERTEFLNSLSPEEVADFEKDWSLWARPNQLPPDKDCPCCGGNWINWLLLAGRGFGKSRTGAEWVHANTSIYSRFHLVGATASDVRDVMVEGESGILSTAKRKNKVKYSPTKRRLDWDNGAMALCYSGEEPERLRGPQCEAAWCISKGELVVTNRGELPIESVMAGDSVVTRFGWRRVRGAMSMGMKPTVRIVTETASVRVTSDHQVWVQERGWTQAQDVSPGDTMLAWKTLSPAPQVSSIGTVSAGTSIGGMATTPIVLGSCFTARYGWKPMAKYPMDLKFTIATMTDPTTASPTLSYSARKNTAAITLPNARTRPGSINTSAKSPPPELTNYGQSESHKQLSVRDAVSVTPQSACEPSSAPLGVVLPSTVLSVEPSWVCEVYDLGVETDHEFFAGGLLVKNCDELAAWEYEETWSQLQLGLRLGIKPRTVITTTPKPTRLIKRLVKDMDRPWPKRLTHVTTGNTFENSSNLSETFINEITSTWDGTRFGRQEIYAEILDDAEAALWNRQLLEDTRVQPNEAPRMKRIVIGVDPAVSFGKESAETGIVVCGQGMDGHGYVLHDSSGRYKPDGWARKVASLYDTYSADRVVAEKNMGGDLVEHTMKVEDPRVPVKLVHASKNKIPRAEPVSTGFEKGTSHMVGFWSQLESQMCTYEAGSQDSPDRMDAMVWAMTELIGKSYVISVPAMIDNELGLETNYWKTGL